MDHLNGLRSIYNPPSHSIRLNEWQHVAITYDNISSVKLYINGIEQNTIVPFYNASGPVASGSQAWIIGEAASTQRAFEGAIDELRVGPTYESVLLDLSRFNRIRWKYVVVDEGHRLKNMESKVRESVYVLGARHTWRWAERVSPRRRPAPASRWEPSLAR